MGDFRRLFVPADGSAAELKGIRYTRWVTTSGMNGWPQLRRTLDVLGRERVTYATDDPFEQQDNAVCARL